MLRGLDSVVAAVLLIVVAVVGVVLVYLWFTGYIGKYTGAADQASAAERYKVESASLAADGTVRLFIRNYGGTPVKIETIYVYPAGSQNPICVGRGINTEISPGTIAAVDITLTCTHTPTPGIGYVIKVVTTKGTEIAYTITATLTHDGSVGVGTGTGGDTSGGAGGGVVVCSFVASSGRWFGSPDGSPATGFNELNGWVAAWGPSGGGVRIALMPGVTPPDSAGTEASYTVELNNVQIGNLTVSGGTASVSIPEPVPGFMEVIRIWMEPGGHVLYDNGPKPAVNVTPGTYQVYATLRAVPRSDIYGSTANLTLTCNGTPTTTITLRVPNPEEWGIRADIYTFTTPSWPPFGAGYTYKGTWSVGAMFFVFWSLPVPRDPVSPYITSVLRDNVAPKWAAYWIDPAAMSWTNWAIKFTGRLYVPWGSIRVGVGHDDGAYMKLCSIDTGNSWWYSNVFHTTSGTCTGAPGEYNIELGYWNGGGAAILVFVIGPGGGDEAYIPTIDGAWYCPNFDWSRGVCSVSWSFVPASPSVPYFVATNYTPSSTNDGGGSPSP